MAEAQRTDHAQQLRRALLAIEKAEARADKLEAARREPIAVVGLGCRFPRATTPSEFWDNLVGGIDCIREVPADRWDVDALFDPDPDAPGKMITRWGGFIDGLDQFDPAFFGIAPSEAERMDPQQRIALEVAWEALEDAGLVAAALAGTAVGVFMGACTSNYAHHFDADLTAIDAHSATGVALSIIANRISYLLNFKGPSIVVDTACSSSLVAIHLACQSLRAGECDVALAGGVNAILTPHETVFFSRARAMALDGRCKAFDARADGFVRGEGCGVVVLKRASDARAAGDRVLAAVRGSAVNQDGTTSGMTAPSGLSQQAVIRRALDGAGIAPDRVGYIEAHGTGTALGDPIEAEALARVLGGPGEAGTCWVGAVKTNIGHLEGGAGVAGFIKAVLALHRGVIPPNLHFQRLNPEISVAGARLGFPTRPVAWRDAGRVAGVSSFGFGGTNAHVVLEAVDTGAPAAPPAAPPVLVLPLSARSEAALGHAARRLAAHLTAHPELALADVCTTAAVGRAQFRHRAAFRADTADEMRAALTAFASGTPAGGAATAVAAPRPRVAFLFTGQGAQYAGMGRALYDGSAVFRAAIDECAAGLSPHLDVPLGAILFPAPGAERLIDETAYTQPALFALEYALVQLWRSWGVAPDVVIGHSLGELVAACVAGVFGLGDALALVAARGQLVQTHARRGAMAAVHATEAEMIERIAPLGGALAIAAVNAPESVVIAGGEDAVTALIERMTAERREARRLPGANAFHSALIEPALDAFEARVAQVALSPPSLVMISNLSGARAGAEVATASYWRRQLRAPVRFREGIAAAAAAGATILVEIGPHATLLGLAAETLGAGGPALVASLRRRRDDRAQIAEALGQVWVHGVAVDWAAVHRAAPGRRVPLPTAPFERRRYWYPRGSAPGSWPGGGEPRERERPGRLGPPAHPLLGRRIAVAGRDDAVFEAMLGLDRLPALGDHRVAGQPILPATGVLEIARAAAAAALGDDHAVEDVVLVEPLAVPESGAVRVQTVIAAEAAGRAGFEIFSQPDGDEAGPWRRHASGVLRRGAIAEPGAGALPRLDRAALEALCPDERSVDDHYDGLAARGLGYGPAFRGIARLRCGAQDALARISPRAAAPELAGCGIDPVLLDLGLQVLGAIAAGAGGLYLPMAVARSVIRTGAHPALWAHARLREPPAPGAQLITGDLVLADDEGACVAVLEGLRLRRVDPAALSDSAGRAAHPWFHHIAWRPRAGASDAADPGTGRPGGWLVIGDDAGAGDALARALQAAGERTVRARHAQRFAPAGANELALDAAQPEEVRRLFDAVGGALRGVAYLAACDRSSDDPGAEVERARRMTAAALHVVQAAARRGDRPALWLVTRGAQPAGGPVDAMQAALWGLGRTVQLEHPELACRLVDLDPGMAGDAAEAAMLAGELLRAGVEDQLALRGGAWLVARLVRGAGAPAAALSGHDNHALIALTPGDLDQLRISPAERPAPGSGEVEIEVEAAGLNFRDVLAALGMYPGDPGPLGGECAGVVRRVGDGVAQPSPGDAVVALAGGAFRRYAIADARLVAQRPAGLAAEDAAALPIAFLTAWYGLHHLAAIQPGDRVLIHAAAGGVGLAAVELARRAGAEVFATASPGKWPVLMARGVEHVMSSRTLDFAGEILARTADRGVDVVLNSLSGEFIPRSLSVLAHGGRFIEIGKRGILDPAAAAALRPDVAYHAFDLARVSAEAPALVAAMLAEVMAGIRTRWLAPLPRRVFPLDQAAAAFRYMAQARHVGKVVLSLGGATGAARNGLRGDATWLVTGGTGGLGLEVARWLVDEGVRSLVLLGRSPPGEAARAAIAAMERAGARIAVVRGDVARREDVARAVAAAGGARDPEAADPDAPGGAAPPPLAGVVHAAGVLDDGVLAQLTGERLERVLAPKIAGALQLDALTRDAPLEAFVMFSSAAALLGSPGQASYAAANAVLDALAHRRRAERLPALSIAWGPWAEVGLAARAGSAARLAAQGFDAIAPDDGRAALGRLMREATEPGVAVLAARWGRVLALSPAGTAPPLLHEIARGLRRGEPAPDPRDALRAELAQAAPGRRRALLIELVRDEVRRVLGFDAARTLELGQGLTELGFDSLMAVELRNRLQKALGRSLPVTLVFDHPTIERISELLGRDVLGLPAEPGPAPAAGAGVAPDDPALGSLSEEAMAALLAEALRDLDDAGDLGGSR